MSKLNWEQVNTISPLQHIRFRENEIKEFQDFQTSMQMKIMAQVIDTTKKAICEAIIRFADEQGMTDLYLIDEKFIKSALIHEIERTKERAK
jgi:hypothetical protein